MSYDLAWIKSVDLHNLADDNKISPVENTMEKLLHTLEKSSEEAIKWFTFYECKSRQVSSDCHWQNK